MDAKRVVPNTKLREYDVIKVGRLEMQEMKFVDSALTFRGFVLIVGFICLSACSDSSSEISSETSQTDTPTEIETSPTPSAATGDQSDIDIASAEVRAESSLALDENAQADLAEMEQSSIMESSLYKVTDGEFLDTDTYRGFIVHRNMCARCHGNFGQGMIGPNLAESLATLSREDFDAIVVNGRNAMPPHSGNPQVMDALDNLYAYYKARADGAIGEVRPRELK